MMLKALQENMQMYILNDDETIFDAIAAPHQSDVKGRLDVYRNAYYLRLLDILAEDFEVLQKRMGIEMFEAVVYDYLRAHPSSSYTVRDVGKKFPDFLNSLEKISPEMIELARFEEALCQAALAEDVKPLTMVDLANVPADDWANVKLRLHPSVNLLLCEYNTLKFWRAIYDDKPYTITKLARPVCVCVWRKNYTSFFRALSHEEARLMVGIYDQCTFSDLCELMLEFFKEEEVVTWVSQYLQEWIFEEIFQA